MSFLSENNALDPEIKSLNLVPIAKTVSACLARLLAAFDPVTPIAHT